MAMDVRSGRTELHNGERLIHVQIRVFHLLLDVFPLGLLEVLCLLRLSQFLSGSCIQPEAEWPFLA